jgi:hypothetical protein
MREGGSRSPTWWGPRVPWVGAATGTQLATIPALTDCPPRNRPQMAWKNRRRGRNVLKDPAARGKAGVQKVLAGAASPIHVAAAIRCQVQSGAEPSRKCATARIACSERMASQGADGENWKSGGWLRPTEVESRREPVQKRRTRPTTSEGASCPFTSPAPARHCRARFARGRPSSRVVVRGRRAPVPSSHRDGQPRT